EGQHPAVAAFAAAAARAGIWLLGGTVAVAADSGRLANRALVFAPDGAIAARYDKIHMFDADLPGQRPYRESDTYRPGDAAVTVDLPWLRLGLSVCYDVRFPALYRSLALAGAGLLAVPSAFTAVTGRAHWHVLLRARAIETGCFVIAPAQCGEHPAGRATFGHALVVSPWGEILADAGETPGAVFADIDPAAITEARTRIPSLRHGRPFSEPI
ncbi:MAG: carbon-nitrogen hydrolase family protein, partial [Proteobacteria bacterium]|nr:carbon-nitrogen hydrolase family protein [Pseudomonadota bacterium]